jgi:hypothetical protein
MRNNHVSLLVEYSSLPESTAGRSAVGLRQWQLHPIFDSKSRMQRASSTSLPTG